MKTCVLCMRRRKALAWRTRSRSRWKAVRRSHSGSRSGRDAPRLRAPAGARRASSRFSCTSRNVDIGSRSGLVDDVHGGEAGEEPLGAVADELDGDFLVAAALGGFGDEA